ncbi:serine/threonine-protein kinase [Streptomyces sp. BPTC-684]|uniref:serine/threonine-protein kinase n=1 Tax=Streptomyces sp. BPTC-684 TaxID=3043734 RepID=UPI0024B23826|nr:serine/threonine-protein kinase [Streptomyces sp. BPTC-684]WHM41319.1 serine/threonine-protein kinase [Streptomyces sp. BPTC-684]
MERLGSGDPLGIGAYRLLARLGAGGMGRVYLARSDRGRTVAVKLVHRELAEREEFRARFRQEVRAARRVGGDWTAPVLDADTEAAVPWVATGYVAGPSLQTVVSGAGAGTASAENGAAGDGGHAAARADRGPDLHGPLPERSVRILARGLAHALQDIHTAGLIHRDLKPSNVLITIDGPRVIDFGIARALETVTDGGLTRTGALVGSPGFMAPEQVRGDRITPACDVFCLGSVLAYAASGKLPFGGSDSGVHALMFRIAQEPPELDGVPESLRELVRDCLHKTPEARPALAAILERLGPEDASSGPWLPAPLVAELGSHAVQLLDVENPEGGTAQTPAPPPMPALPPVTPTPTVVSPNGTGSGLARPGYAAPAPPPWANGGQPAPAHSYPYQQPHAAYGYPHPNPTYGYGPPPPPEEPPRRSAKSTIALIAVALVVAIGAGGAVYAYMNDPLEKKDGKAASPSATKSPSSTPSSGDSESPSASPSASAPGDIPRKYLGAWSGTIDNDSGRNNRHLVIRPGKVGDQVMTLTADGPLDGGGTYHCIFRASLTATPPTPDAPLRLGPSTVESGPTTSCSPGASTTLTVLPDGRLRRQNDDTGEQLTYDKVPEAQ